MDYSNRFADSLADDFNHGVEVRDVVKEDMILVQFSSDAPNASLRYWTTIDEANGISTIEEYMDKMALSKEWGNRNVVKVARVKKGTEVTHAIGTAKAQTKISDPRPGNGKQILFSKFDSNWCNLLEYLTQRDIQTKNSVVNVRYRGKHRFFKGFNEFIKEKTRRCDNDFEKIERYVFF